MQHAIRTYLFMTGSNCGVVSFLAEPELPAFVLPGNSLGAFVHVEGLDQGSLSLFMED